MFSSCDKIRGPRGLRQSEWVVYCLENPGLDLCSLVPPLWPMDSVYLGALIFEPDQIREYRCDTVAGEIVCEWYTLIPTGSDPDIRQDTIFIKSPSGSTGLFGYSLEDGILIITSANSTLSDIEPGTVFTNVKEIPANYSGIVELP